MPRRFAPRYIQPPLFTSPSGGSFIVFSFRGSFLTVNTVLFVLFVYRDNEPVLGRIWERLSPLQKHIHIISRKILVRSKEFIKGVCHCIRLIDDVINIFPFPRVIAKSGEWQVKKSENKSQIFSINFENPTWMEPEGNWATSHRFSHNLKSN